MGSSFPFATHTYLSHWWALLSFHLSRKCLLQIIFAFILNDPGRIYGLIFITTEQLLLAIGHKLANRFSQRREWINCFYISFRGALAGYILPCAVLAAISNFPQWLLYQTVTTEAGWGFEIKTDLSPLQARGNTHWGQVRQRPLLSPFRQSCLRRSPTSFHFFNTPARILPSSKVKNLKAKVRCNRSNNFIFSFFTRLPSRNPSHLLLCILLALLSNLPRHTLDMVEAVQVSVPLGLSTNIFSTSQAVNSSASVPPAWSLLLSKLFLPLAPATTSFVLFCQVGLYPDCKRWKGHPV